MGSNWPTFPGRKLQESVEDLIACSQERQEHNSAEEKLVQVYTSK